MKNSILHFCILLLAICHVISKMSDKERQNLMNKLTRKISKENLEMIKSRKQHHYSQKLKSMDYSVEKINEILNTYDFQQNFSFFDDTTVTPVIKDQASCGCCWSHAATTSLAYRYHKIGIEVDLSPQDGLSCYLRDCEAGNFLIDPELNLIKNGTLTEGCLPFSSGDGRTIEKCPTTCKDGSEFKKYYAQNAYMTEDYYSQENFYEIVTLMFDQLINNGPIVTGIDVYQDFVDLHYDQEKCHNEVYTYDGKSEYLGGHAVVIVGYGYMNSKFYWLIQNSWGEDACDHGFVKVEFGQIGVEQIAFVEPYVHKEVKEPKNVNINVDSFDGLCDIVVSADSSSEYWENTLDIGFKNSKNNRNFNYQCSLVETIQGKKKVCYYDIYNYYLEKGIYKFEKYQSLGDENVFTLDLSKIPDKQINFYGIEELYYVFSPYLFVSEENSKILLYYASMRDYEKEISPIYATADSKKPLSDCKIIVLFDIEFAYCDIKANEVDDFNDMSLSYDMPLANSILCGYKEENEVIVYKLDKTKYPVFKIKRVILPREDTISSNTKLTVVADIEGSLSDYDADQSYFLGISEIDISDFNLTCEIECVINKPERVMKNYEFYCYPSITPGYIIPYKNLYLYPFNIPFEVYSPFEIFIRDTIKAEKETPIPKIQVYIESLCPDCVNFITKSFKDFYENVQKPNLADIEFIPYGNAKEKFNEETQKYEFECQHGENECYGNLIETCAIQVMGRVQSYSTILCIESNIAKYSKDFDKTLAFCLSNDEESLNEVKECVQSDMGNYYEHQMAQKTETHTWVPWVVVNGIHDPEVENQIINSLIDYVCGDDRSKCYTK
jgi:interferon gamma-inducible protein 30